VKLTQVAQRATDLDRAAAFYSTVLQSMPTARFEPPGLLFFDLDGTRLLLDNKAPSALLYLQVDDLEATIARLEGVEVTTPPHLIFEHQDDSIGPAGAQEWQAFIRDSEGNMVGLVERRWAK
jgi:methylmalonyl-CoA/ethylmalonyl-CoA epimerase